MLLIVEISQTLVGIVSDYLDGVKIAVQENHSSREEVDPVGFRRGISKDSRAAKLRGVSQTQGGSVNYFSATRILASTI